MYRKNVFLSMCIIVRRLSKRAIIFLDFPNGNYSAGGASFTAPDATRPNMFSPDKMSTISSEDIEMAGNFDPEIFVLVFDVAMHP